MRYNTSKLVARIVVCSLTLAASLFTPPASAQTYNVLYTFTGTPDGSGPQSGMLRAPTRASSADFYGTTFAGGTYGQGAIFKLAANGQESVLYSFTGGSDGGNPTENGALIRDAAGNLYGATNAGGSIGCGVVFKLSSNGVETVLHDFQVADGCEPFSGLYRDAAGNMYGTTGEGPIAGNIYKITPSGQFTNLYNFTGGVDGGGPGGDLIIDQAGNIYGTATFGGAYNNGTVFELMRGGILRTLYPFTGGSDGGGPEGLTRDSTGNFYGVAANGGANHLGTLFKLSGHTFTLLHTFGGADDAHGAQQSPVLDPDGNIYGTLAFGGPNNRGAVYKFGTDGMYQLIYSFTGGTDGATPFGSDLTWTPPGILYGTAAQAGNFGSACQPNGCGVLFSLTTQ